jgi:Predicted endonuclease containing a URI domain
MRDKYSFVYLLASKPYCTLYTGVTSDLILGAWQHKNYFVECFTTKYGVHRLVNYKQYESIESAINREKQIKKWKRRWKLDPVEKMNPD